MDEEQQERKKRVVVESLGWLTESSIMPKKQRSIDGVGPSSILELKAQLYQSQEESKKSKELNGPDVEFHRAKKKIASRDSFSLKNSGVDARAHKDKLELKAVNDGSASYAALEKKAELYEKLVRGELSDEEDKEKYCVDFFRKGTEQELQQPQGSDVFSAASADNNEHEEDGSMLFNVNFVAPGRFALCGACFSNSMAAIATAAALSLPITVYRPAKINAKKGVRGGFRVFAVFGEEGGLVDKKSAWSTLFNVEDPRSKVPQCKGKFLDVNQALEVARYDIQYCDWRARRDVLTIMLLHEKVVEVLNPLARDFKSIGTMKKELAELQEDLAQAHRQVHMSEARVATALDKLAYMEALVNDRLLQDTNTSKSDQTCTSMKYLNNVKGKLPQKSLNVSGPVQPYNSRLKNFWYPVAFSTDLKDDTMVPIDCFEEPWVIFRGKDGKPGCVQNTCAHRACPLHLGSVNEGRIQCPYHGWEYSTDGKCEKMPSTRLLNVKIKSLPCFEQEGMIWIWPGDDPPTATIPSLLPPSGYEIHAEIVMELPIEHGLLLDNLLDLAHAPFTHTSTFAKGWSVPSLVKFLTPASGLQGYWDPYPIDMEFRPPCMVLSTIGISKPGKLEGQNARQCATHLHQLHVCLPSSTKKTRLLYRMSLDFAPVLKHIPFMQFLWRHFAEQVLNEDLRLVVGQQERMNNGANVWNLPVGYDKLGVRYRLWRDALERGAKQLPFTKPL